MFILQTLVKEVSTQMKMCYLLELENTNSRWAWRKIQHSAKNWRGPQCFNKEREKRHNIKQNEQIGINGGRKAKANRKLESVFMQT